MLDNDYGNHSGDPKEPWENEDSSLNGEEETTNAKESFEEDEEAEKDAAADDTQPIEEPPTAGEGDSRQDSQNQQNPYYPYGSNGNNPYWGNTYGNNSYGSGSYGNNPYGQYPNQSYGGYNPYGGYQNNQYNQYPYGQNQYQQPNRQGQQYWTYQQYGGQYSQQNPQPNPPRKSNTGLKVFLWILGVLIAGSVLGFSVYSVYTSIEQKNAAPYYSGASSQAEPNQDGSTSGSAAGNASSGSGSVESAAPGNGTNPNGSGIVISPKPSGDPLPAKEVYRRVVQSVVGVETEVNNAATGETGTGQGTGIIATSNGYILTNAHVVNYSRSNKVTVILYNKKEYAATVVGYDKTSDIAVLKINANGLSPATFGNADQLEVGDSVVAIGNPGGLNYASSLTGGLVSALDRTIENHSDNGMTYIQTDAAINPGNSGGPLVNMYGQVVGINSNKIVATGFEGMGFAIPISKAKTIIDDLVARGYVSGRSRLGITATEITSIQAQLSGLPTGVMIRDISAESDLRKSNVQKGDIITKADGQKISSLDDLYAVLSKHKAGDVITLTIYSQTTGDNGSIRDVKTKLLEDKGETQTK